MRSLSARLGIGVIWACVFFAVVAAAIGTLGVLAVGSATSTGNSITRDELATATVTAQFGDGQVTKVRQDRRGLTDRVADVLLFGRVVLSRSIDQNGPDDLAAHGQRGAGRIARTTGADRAAHERRPMDVLMVGASGSHGQAGAGFGMGEAWDQR